MIYTKKKIQLQNEEYAYIDEGEGEVILLIHGNMSSSAHYSPLIDRLKGSFRVVAPDLRGFGDTTYNERFDTIEELADDVKEFCDKLNLTRVNLVGWSMGGGVSLKLCAKYPELVTAFFSIEGSSHMGYPLFKKDKYYQQMFGKCYKDKEEMCIDPVQLLPAINIFKTNNVALMNNIWDAVIYTVKRPDSEADHQYWMSETMKQRCIIDVNWALANFNMSNKSNYYSEGDGTIDNIICPCAFTSGEKDFSVPSHMVMCNVDALKDKAKLIIYENVGHSPLSDIPDRLAKDVQDFFEQNRM